MKIFISYNHKDQLVALQIKSALINAGYPTIMDIENMKAGQDIEQFILESIRNSDVTLSLISRNSLLSAWVAMETITSATDIHLRSRKLIPCYIDTSFFDRSFTSDSLDAINENIADVDKWIKTAIDKGYGIEDLQHERTRLKDLENNLSKIIDKFRKSLCIDLTPGNFEAGMQKVVTDIQLPPLPIPPKQPEPNQILKEINMRRIETLNKQLLMLTDLLSEFQMKLVLEDDPRRILNIEQQISRTEKEVEKITDQIQSLAS